MEVTDIYMESDDSLHHTDQYDISFIDDGFMAERGLSEDTVIDYFKRSPFFEEGDGIRVEMEKTNEEPNFFIIVKYWTHPVKDEEDLRDEIVAIYYIVDGRLFQCPDLYSLLKYRMFNCVNSLNRSYKELRKYVSFSPKMGHRIEMTKVTADTDTDKYATESPTCNVIPLIGEGRVRNSVDIHQRRLDAMIADMNKVFLKIDETEGKDDASTVSSTIA